VLARTIPLPSRRARRLEVGKDIPAPAEIRAVVAGLGIGRARPLLLTVIFTGLRASELRGLRWGDVDLSKGELHVRQRADRFGVMGAPKSAGSRRTVPLLPMVANALREWRLACPGELVFPGDLAQPISMRTVVRAWQAAQIAAGVVTDGGAKYPGLHALRHFYASWCINRKADGGLELPIKGGAGPARPRHDPNDSGHLRPSVPARRRQRRAGGRRAGFHECRPMRRLLFAGVLVLIATGAYADNWRQRAQNAVANAVPPHQQCVRYAERADNRLHVRVPVCFYNNGDVYLESDDGYLTFNNRKAGATHPEVKRAGVVENVERVDPTTFLVLVYCKGATPERDTVSVQLIGDTISIRNTEAY
jgi:hypothetical protein